MIDNISPFSENMEGSFITDNPVGKFFKLGITNTGQLHFYILNSPSVKDTKLFPDIASKIEVVSNCVRYKLITEVGSGIGSLFVTELNKTVFSTWYCLINNSRYGDTHSDTDANNLEHFSQIADSEYYGCLTLYSNRGDVCLISTLFDHPKFSAIDLI